MRVRWGSDRRPSFDGSQLNRSAWSIADQGISSLSNLAFGVIAARNLDVAAFGAVGVMLALYAIALNFVRGLISTPLTVTTAGKSVTDVARQASKSLGLTLAVATLLGAVLGIVTIGAGLGNRNPMVALAIGLPLLLAQDHLRFVFVAQAKPHCALAIDGIWLLSMLPALTLGPHHWHGNAFVISLVWVAGSGLSLAIGLLIAVVRPSMSGAARFLRGSWSLAWRLSLESGIVGVSRQAAILTSVVILGVAAVSGIRAAQMLMGPYTVIAGGMMLMATAEATRLLNQSHTRMIRFLVALSTGLTVAALLTSWVLWLTPEALGRALLGASWAPAQDAIIFFGLWAAAAGVQAGAYVGLNALRAASSSLKLRASFMVFTVLGTAVGAAFAGVTGALACAAVVDLLSGLAAWRALGRHARGRTTAVRTNPETLHEDLLSRT